MAINVLDAINIISNVSESIASITKTISDNTTERERIRMQGRQMDAEIAERMNMRDAEAKKFLQEQQSKLDMMRIEHETKMAEIKVLDRQNKDIYKKEVKECRTSIKNE